MTVTNGGKNIQPGDTSSFAHQVMILGLPPKKETSQTSLPSDGPGSPFASNTSKFGWLGDPSNMQYTGKGDAHKCWSCGLTISNFVPGDTLLNQHAFFTEGACSYLKGNYTPDRLKIEIGQERFRRGFVAHPNAINAPDAWNCSAVEVKNRIYVTLAEQQWCYMCGRPPGSHGSQCYQKMRLLIDKLESSLNDVIL